MGSQNSYKHYIYYFIIKIGMELWIAGGLLQHGALHLVPYNKLDVISHRNTAHSTEQGPGRRIAGVCLATSQKTLALESVRDPALKE